MSDVLAHTVMQSLAEDRHETDTNAQGSHQCLLTKRHPVACQDWQSICGTNKLRPHSACTSNAGSTLLAMKYACL